MELYLKLISINKYNNLYPFNEKIKDNIEFTKNQLELNYIKKYNKCVKENKNKTGKCEIIVFSQ